MWMLFSSLIFLNGSPNAGNLLLRRKWYLMSHNTKINKTPLSVKCILKYPPFTSSSSSFYSWSGTVLSGMNFARDLELILDLNLYRSIPQAAAVLMGMLCLHGKCCFRASHRHVQKRRWFALGSWMPRALVHCLCQGSGWVSCPLLMCRSDGVATVITSSPALASQGSQTVLGSPAPNLCPGQRPALPHSQLAKFSFTYTADKSFDGFVLI